uniref:intramembrane prenyl-peptidase Rce1 n=1 Tax=Toxoplasma gondii (strain ATCC 50861 / VEG) TaxID=432359 RepID=A0A0F7VDE4_TOXGV|nr:TPA: hypothetical protein BN1205_001725 [Toxoplasma gondii VEG]
MEVAGGTEPPEVGALVWGCFCVIPSWLAVCLCVFFTCSYVTTVYAPQIVLCTFRYFCEYVSTRSAFSIGNRRRESVQTLVGRKTEPFRSSCEEVADKRQREFSSYHLESDQRHSRFRARSCAETASATDRSVPRGHEAFEKQKPLDASFDVSVLPRCGMRRTSRSETRDGDKHVMERHSWSPSVCVWSSVDPTVRSTAGGPVYPDGISAGRSPRSCSTNERNEEAWPPCVFVFPTSAEIPVVALAPATNDIADEGKTRASYSSVPRIVADGRQDARIPGADRVPGRCGRDAPPERETGSFIDLCGKRRTASHVSTAELTCGIIGHSGGYWRYLLQSFSEVDFCSVSTLVSRSVALVVHSVVVVGLLVLAFVFVCPVGAPCCLAGVKEIVEGNRTSAIPGAPWSSTEHGCAGEGDCGRRLGRMCTSGDVHATQPRRCAPAEILVFLLYAFGIPQAVNRTTLLPPSLVSVRLLSVLYGPSVVVRCLPHICSVLKYACSLTLRVASVCSSSCIGSRQNIFLGDVDSCGGNTSCEQGAKTKAVSSAHLVFREKGKEMAADKAERLRQKLLRAGRGELGFTAPSLVEGLASVDSDIATVGSLQVHKKKLDEQPTQLGRSRQTHTWEQATRMVVLLRRLEYLTNCVRDEFWPFARACVVAPIVEEFLFRGVLVALLFCHFGRTLTCTIVSILFAFAHIHPFLVAVLAEKLEHGDENITLRMHKSQRNQTVSRHGSSYDAPSGNRRSCDVPYVKAETEKRNRVEDGCVHYEFRGSQSRRVRSGELIKVKTSTETQVKLFWWKRTVQRWKDVKTTDDDGNAVRCFRCAVARVLAHFRKCADHSIQVVRETLSRAQQQLLLTFVFSWACTYLHISSVNFPPSRPVPVHLHMGVYHQWRAGNPISPRDATVAGSCVVPPISPAEDLNIVSEHTTSIVWRRPALFAAVVLHAGCNLMQWPDMSFLHDPEHPMYLWGLPLSSAYGAAIVGFITALASL